MLEKVPSTVNDQNTVGTLRSGGIPIQPGSTSSDAMSRKNDSSCC